jgi:hypothetical protein
MRVDEFIERLKREQPDEEVVVIVSGDSSEYKIVDDQPFLHGGPASFVDKDGNQFSKSVVIVRLK